MSKPDHTGPIRARIKRLAINGAVGLALAAVGAGAATLVAHVADSPLPEGLIRAVWIAGLLVLTLSLLQLAIAMALWVNYQSKRPELDAAGGEVSGELRARIANSKRLDS